MRWIRSYPHVLPERKSYIVDGLEKFYQTDYDYTGLVDVREDLCLIEWDLALSQEGREMFEWYIKAQPHHIFVAPYLLYEGRKKPVWAHRRIDINNNERWVTPSDQYCDFFGFGVIYLPHALVTEFVNAPKLTRGTPPGREDKDYTDYRFIDQTFSVWHWRSGKGPVRIVWDVRPVHLNEGKWPR